MPTGYTADLCQGDQSFAFFALGCAKAFGACIEQRDSPIAELPQAPKKRDSHHDTSLYAAQAMLDTYAAMSKEDRKTFGIKKKQHDIAYNTNAIKERIVIRERLEKMIQQTNAWIPPTPDHVGLKKFMLEQLTATLEHDGSTEYYDAALAKAKAATPLSYYRESVLAEERNIEYHQRELLKEESCGDGRSKWISELYLSLGDDAELAWTLLQK